MAGCAAMSATMTTMGLLRAVPVNNVRCARISGALSSARSHVLGAQIAELSAKRTSIACRRPQRAVVVRAEESSGDAEKSGFGLGGPGTWFGFGPRQELNVGRLAMMGFVAGIVMEVVTGKGILAQLGIDPIAIRFPFLAGMAFLFVGGLLGGYTVINNPPNFDRAPVNEGDGLPRNPLKTFDSKTDDPLTTYTRGGVTTRPDGQKGREPYVSDLVPPPKEEK
eukprot:TRINITY_DN36163_c0_g1_i1.p2 TRINITY_DN36163_c0_g1~~TRINITY_DN36163_c0_g1_i1.p2  ORF type:complete len:223 (-),score=33.27 TRINITY_DN36163_c0_g1_i1:670-1338(-)